MGAGAGARDELWTMLLCGSAGRAAEDSEENPREVAGRAGQDETSRGDPLWLSQLTHIITLVDLRTCRRAARSGPKAFLPERYELIDVFI